MKRIHIPKKLYEEIKEYCEYNNLEDITKEIVSYIQSGFNLVKYGNSPFIPQIKTKIKEQQQALQEEYDNVFKGKCEKNQKKGITIIKN